MMKHLLAFTIGLSTLAAGARGQGLLIPAERDIAPLAVRSHTVQVDVDGVAAVTRVEQVFENNTDRDLEATYIFPVPAGAVMNSFVLSANGVERKGELCDKHVARHLYGLALTAGQAPGRLEESLDGVFKAVIHPVPAHGVQTLKLTYHRVLPRDAGMTWYEYPVPVGSAAPASAAFSFHLEGTIKSTVPIKTVYSPSHAVVVDRPSPDRARFRLDSAAPLDRGFRLAHSISDRDVAIDLVTHRVNPGEPGYFMLLVSPGAARTEARRVERDVLFVFDRSGSMAGEKMDQARRALKYCVTNLEDGDRFDIVTFSNEAEAWKGEFTVARTGRAGALAHIDGIPCDGGTNIHSALAKAMSYPRDPARPTVIIFMTDGKPTLGDTTDAGELLKLVSTSQTGARARIFTWGLGYDLDTHLIDRLAEENGGIAEYVAPGEDLALKVEAFQRKAAHPVMTDLTLTTAGGVRLAGVYPRKLPELYAGGSLVVLGRYSGTGRAKLELTGRMNGAVETLSRELDFPDGEAKHAFVAPLWARRHIGHLLDAVRELGERSYLIDKIAALSQQHGVQTPYTSFLVKDGNTVVVASALPLGPVPVLAATGPSVAGGGAPAEALADGYAEAAAPVPQSAFEGARSRLQRFAGKDAAQVHAARARGQLKYAEHLSAEPRMKVGSLRLVQRGEAWYDERFDASCSLTAIQADSPAAARVLARRHGLAQLAGSGTTFVLVTGTRRAVVIGSEGATTLSDAELSALFDGAAD